MKYALRLLLFITILFFSLDVKAQEKNNLELAVGIQDEQSNEVLDPIYGRYFEDIYHAKLKIKQIKKRVENNYENDLLKDKMYQKQLVSLNNILINLDILEDKRLHILNKRNE